MIYNKHFEMGILKCVNNKHFYVFIVGYNVDSTFLF